ncbi:hypothetical protein F5Y15DRAFT_64203 [Xylariaceae sp. FL0016]|nr:hypothetical protein F5Y15DRAFT_64203 [Xylariaceae sp. FL0016]
MANISWGTIKSLLIFFGPMLLPKIIAYYRSVKNAPRNHGITIQPLPRPAFRALLLLGLTSAFFLLLALPLFSPENIFIRTQSRLQIPTDVLFSRLSTLRPGKVLTDADTVLRAKFVNMESRLLYLQFGPAVLSQCPFCTADDPRSYFYYALPPLLAPHLVSLVALSLATSDLVSGSLGARWRKPAAIAALLLAVFDVYAAHGYNYQRNARATRLAELDLFYWHARAYRNLALAALSALTATALYLSSTNRFFVAPPSPAARVEAVAKGVQNIRSRINAVGIVKNTSIRDEELRGRLMAYWAHEGRLMREVMEEREVVEGVNDALTNRINIGDISRDAETYAGNMLPRARSDAPETSVG